MTAVVSDSVRKMRLENLAELLSFDLWIVQDEDNLQEALSRSFHPLLLVDFNVHGMDPIGAIAAAQQLKKDLRVVVFNADPTPEQSELLQGFGVERFYNEGELEQLLRELSAVDIEQFTEKS